jgi:glycerol-3-phosphate acyltransferase PlsX
MHIALDAMGGDYAPGPIVAGAVQAVSQDSDLRVTLVGDEAQIHPLLDQFGRSDRLEVFHCSQSIGMEESPTIGLRKKPDNSISRCWQLLAQSRVDGIVSAGNTGAMVAGGLMSRRFLPGVERPGIATVMPTMRGPCLLLDVGANIYPKASHLYQYGVMGLVYARHILKKDNPSIGLMNVGSEDGKGPELPRQTAELFANSPIKGSYRGNVEGRDIHRGGIDVVICDGFTGNVILKVCEGITEFMLKVVAREMSESLTVERDKGINTLTNLAQKYHYSEFGGAPLLGIDGICIICHGSSDDRAIRNALGVAARHARAGLNQLITKEIESQQQHLALANS